MKFTILTGFLVVLIGLFLMTIPDTCFCQPYDYQKKKSIQLAGPSPFQKEIDGKVPGRIIFQDSLVTILDGLPGSNQLPIHLLGVPNKRIPSLNELSEDQSNLIGHLVWELKNQAAKKGIDSSGYRIVFNTNEDAGQSAFHIHAHLLGGLKTGPMVDQGWRNIQRARRARTDSAFRTPSTMDPFLTKLLGGWQAKGRVFDIPADIIVRCEPELQLQFIRMNYHTDIFPTDSTSSSFEGNALYRPIGNNQYRGTWYDTDGNIYALKGKLENNTLTVEWKMSSKKKLKTLYRLVDENTLEITEQGKEKNDHWSTYSRNTLTRKY